MRKHVPPVLPRQWPHARVSRRDAAQSGNEPVSSVMCVFQRCCTPSAAGQEKKKSTTQMIQKCSLSISTVCVGQEEVTVAYFNPLNTELNPICQ